MALPDDTKKRDEIFDALIQLLAVTNRQVVAMHAIVMAMKSDAPNTVTLPDPPKLPT